MSRTPHKPAPILPDPSTVAEAHALTLAEDAEACAIDQEMIFTAGKITSRIETALFYETVSQKVAVESYLELKKTKAWAAVTYRDTDGKAKRFSSLDDYCRIVMKQSQRRVQQLADNYHTIGADLYETAEQMGFRQKDYTALRALPADDQEVIKQAMQPDVDRDQILDLMQELAVRHASEKAALESQAKDARETKDSDLKARDAREAKLNADNHELLKKVIRIEEATPQEDYAMLAAELAKCVYSIQASLMSLRAGFSKLILKGDEHAIAYTETLTGHVTQLHRELNRVRNEYGLPIEPDKTDIERGFEFAEAELAREQAERGRTVN